jgi:hypothetical protein
MAANTSMNVVTIAISTTARRDNDRRTQPSIRRRSGSTTAVSLDSSAATLTAIS